MKPSPGRRSPAVRAAVALGLIAVAVLGLAPVMALGATEAGATNTPYVVKTVRLASNSVTTARWNPCQPAIAWRSNLQGLPAAARPALLNQLRQAFTRLAGADGMKYHYLGDTDFVPRQNNLVAQPADIVVAAVSKSATDFDFTDTSLGYGGALWATWYGDSGEGAAIVRGYAILVPSGLAKLKPGFGAGRSQGDLILHELGHATGLEHTADHGQQMFATLTPAAPRGYARGDLAGLSKLGIRPGCIDIPARVNVKDYN